MSAPPTGTRLAALVGDISPIQAERLRQLLALVPTDAVTHTHAGE
jgi:hypothetical protein